MSAKPKADWIAIEGEFRAGRRSLRDMASDHGITEGAIRKRAKAEGCSLSESEQALARWYGTEPMSWEV